MKLKRYECVLEHRKETMSESVITNASSIGKGAVIRIRGIEWTVKVAVPAETDHVQFGDIVHEVKESTPTKSK